MNQILHILYCIYQLVVGVPVVIIITIITALEVGIGCAIGDGHFWGYYPGRWWAKVIIRTLLLPVRVEGREHLEKDRSYVFVANHQGAFDIFLIYGFLGRNFRWMMKRELRSIPFIGLACERAGEILIDRSSPARMKHSLIQAEKTLQGGTSLVVFPEGTRTRTGRVGPFRKGAFVLADELKLPVVPLTVSGPFRALPRSKYEIGFVKRVPLTLTIHAPVPYTEKGQRLQPSRDTIVRSLPPNCGGESPSQNKDTDNTNTTSIGSDTRV